MNNSQIPDFPEQNFGDGTLSAAASMNEMAQALGSVSSQDEKGVVKSSLEVCLMKLALNFKEVLTLEESAVYCDLSVSRMYKLSCENQLHFTKPGGKRAYISRADLNDWLLGNSSRNLIVKRIQR